MISRRDTADRLAAELQGLGARLIRAELSHGQAEHLRYALSEE